MNKMKFSTIIILVFLLGILMLPSNRAATVNSNWMTTTPTIDGTITAGEWDDAAATVVSAYDSTSETYLNIYFWAKNNASYLFLRLQWADATHDTGYDFVVIYFDEQNDGSYGTGGVENLVYCVMNISNFIYWDGYADTSQTYNIGLDSGSKDGVVMGTYNIANYIVEGAIPIGLADAEDLQVPTNLLIGIAFTIYDDSSTDFYEYPVGHLDNYSTNPFQLAAAPSGVGTPILPFFLVALTFLLVLEIVQQKRSDLLK